MKIIVTLFLLFNTVYITDAQTKEVNNREKIDFAFGITVGAHFNTLNKQFDNLNTSLNQSGYPTIYPAFNSIGVAMVFKSAKNYGFTEASIVQAQAETTQRDRLMPKLQGFNFRSIYTKKLWEKKKLRLDGGFGMSMSKFHFKMVDRLPIQSPFDTLLKSPISASGALDYAQIGFNWSVEGRLGLTYNANWFKKIADAYEFSIFINYSQAIINAKNWSVSDTKIKIPNFPTINFSNCYFQFVNSVYFKRSKPH